MRAKYSKNPKQKYIELFLNGHPKRSETLKYQIIPNRLFRYQPPLENRFITLGKKELYLSNTKCFDDPFDSLGVYWNTDSIYKVFQEIKPNIILEDVNSFLDTMFQEIRDNLTLVCFSEDLYSLPLWGTYAEKNTGFVIEYNFRQYDGESPLLQNLFPVLYRSKKIDITKSYCDFIKMIENPTNMPYHTSILLYCLFIKHQSWSYQKEWRLFNFENKQSITNITPSAIYAGLQSTEKTKTRLQKISKQLGCVLYTTKLPKNNEDEFIYAYN